MTRRWTIRLLAASAILVAGCAALDSISPGPTDLPLTMPNGSMDRAPESTRPSLSEPAPIPQATSSARASR